MWSFFEKVPVCPVHKQPDIVLYFLRLVSRWSRLDGGQKSIKFRLGEKKRRKLSGTGGLYGEGEMASAFTREGGPVKLFTRVRTWPKSRNRVVRKYTKQQWRLCKKQKTYALFRRDAIFSFFPRISQSVFPRVSKSVFRGKRKSPRSPGRARHNYRARPRLHCTARCRWPRRAGMRASGCVHRTAGRAGMAAAAWLLWRRSQFLILCVIHLHHSQTSGDIERARAHRGRVTEKQYSYTTLECNIYIFEYHR